MNRLRVSLLASSLAAGCGSTGAAVLGDASIDGPGPTPDGSTCSWSGTWLPDASPFSGDCGQAPAFPELHIDDDGGLAIVVDGAVLPCAVSQPSLSSCQVGGLCAPWQISANFTDCPASLPCSAVATDLAGSGQCSVQVTFTRSGP
jgi:hypothetical protein